MLAWLTFVAAAIAASASGVTVWRQWHSWSVDRVTKRFDDALERSLSDDEVTARTGREQLIGMVDRHELSRKDEGYVNDTIAGLLGPPGPAGPVVVVDDVGEDDGDNGPGGQG